MSDTEYIPRSEAVRQLGISMSTADRWFSAGRGVYRDRCKYILKHPRSTRWFNVMVPVSLINEIIAARNLE